jgi:hypothetical protein
MSDLFDISKLPYLKDCRPIQISSDDSLKGWINDNVVQAYWIKRGSNPDRDTVAVQLTKGWNKITLKAEQGVGEWGFYCRASNPQGDLRFSVEPK